MDYFYGDIKTSPNNSFNDIANPSKSDRKTKGNGDYHNTQQRLDVSLGYNGKISESATFEAKAFYHLNKIKYKDSITNLTNFAYSGRFIFAQTSADQSGSLFDDQKAGLKLKYDYKQSFGRFILGYDSIYQMSKRTMEQIINASGGRMINQTTGNIGYYHPIHIPFEGNKWSNALYAIEKLDFTDKFSLVVGGRYEYSRYDINVTNRQSVNVDMQGNGTYATFSNVNTTGTLKDSLHNYALEVAPSFRYSDSGNVYVKYEKGFFSPSPNNMMARNGTGNTPYTPTDLKQENYHTFELGFKDMWANASISAAAFYTLTTNEFYTVGNAHSASGVQYGNYDRTQRAGVEVFLEQFFFDEALRFSESFTYIDAKVLKSNGIKLTENNKIPYVNNYKATLSAHWNMTKHLAIWTQNSFYGKSVDITQKSIKPYSITDIGLSGKIGDLTLSAGVRNVFDTFCYSYYNGDSSDTIAGYGFLIGNGRTAFIEERFSF